MAKPAVRWHPDAAPEKRPAHYSIEGAAAYAGVSTRSIRRAVESGDLAAVRPRGLRVLRIPAAALDAWLLPASGLGRVR